MNNIAAKNVRFGEKSQKALPYLSASYVQNRHVTDNLNSILINNAFRQLVDNDVYIENKLLNEAAYAIGPKTNDAEAVRLASDGYKYWGSSLEQDVTVYRKVNEPVSATVKVMPGFEGRGMNFVAEYGGFYFAGSSDGLRISKDLKTWSLKSTDSSNDYVGGVWNYCKNDQFMLFCGDGGVYALSSYEVEDPSGGETARYEHQLLRLNRNVIGAARSAAWKKRDGMLFVGTDSGIYSTELLVRSITPSAVRQLVFERNETPASAGRVSDFAVAEEVETAPDENVVAAAAGCMLRSSKAVSFVGDGSDQYVLAGELVNDVVAYGDYTFYATYGGIYRSDDLTRPSAPVPAYGFRVTEAGALYAAGQDGIYDIRAGRYVYFAEGSGFRHISPKMTTVTSGSRTYDVYVIFASSGGIYTLTVDRETGNGDISFNSSIPAMGRPGFRNNDILVINGASTLNKLTVSNVDTPVQEDAGGIAAFVQKPQPVSEIDRVFVQRNNVYGAAGNSLYVFEPSTEGFRKIYELAPETAVLDACELPGLAVGAVTGLDMAIAAYDRLVLVKLGDWGSPSPAVVEIPMDNAPAEKVCYWNNTVVCENGRVLTYFPVSGTALDASSPQTVEDADVVEIAANGGDFLYTRSYTGVLRRYSKDSSADPPRLVRDEDFLVDGASSLRDSGERALAAVSQYVFALPDTEVPVAQADRTVSELFVSTGSLTFLRTADGVYETYSDGAVSDIGEVKADGMPLYDRSVVWAFPSVTAGVETVYYRIDGSLYTADRKKRYRLDISSPATVCSTSSPGMAGSAFAALASSSANDCAYLVYSQGGKYHVRIVDVVGNALGDEIDYYVTVDGEVKHINEDAGYDLTGVQYVNDDNTAGFFIQTAGRTWASVARSNKRFQPADTPIAPVRAVQTKYGYHMIGADGVFNFVRLGSVYQFSEIDGTSGAQFRKIEKRRDFEYVAASSAGIYSVLMTEIRGGGEDEDGDDTSPLDVTAYRVVDSGDFSYIAKARFEDGTDRFVYTSGGNVYETKNFRSGVGRDLMFAVPSDIRTALRKSKYVYYVAAEDGLYFTDYSYHTVVDNPRFTATSAQALYARMADDISGFVSAGISSHVDAAHGELTSGVEWLNANALAPDFETETEHIPDADYNLSAWTKKTASGETLSVVNDMPEYVWFGDQTDGDLTASVSNFTTGGGKHVKLNYIVKRYNSGVTEVYVYLPTTDTYYIGHIPGSENCAVPQTELIPRKNLNGVVQDNRISSSLAYSTRIDLAMLSVLYSMDGGQPFDVEINGNSLPLKIYRDDTYAGLESDAAGYYHSFVEPSIVHGYTNSTDEYGYYHFSFSCFGSDAQAIRFSFYDPLRRRPEDTVRVKFDPNGGSGDMPYQRLTLSDEFVLRPNAFQKPNCVFMGWSVGIAPQDNQTDYVRFEDGARISLAALRDAGYRAKTGGIVTLYATWVRYVFSDKDTEFILDSDMSEFSIARVKADPGILGIGNKVIVDFGD